MGGFLFPYYGLFFLFMEYFFCCSLIFMCNVHLYLFVISCLITETEVNEAKKKCAVLY